jgi:hypothetical protein
LRLSFPPQCAGVWPTGSRESVITLLTDLLGSTELSSRSSADGRRVAAPDPLRNAAAGDHRGGRARGQEPRRRSDGRVLDTQPRRRGGDRHAVRALGAKTHAVTLRRCSRGNESTREAGRAGEPGCGAAAGIASTSRATRRRLVPSVPPRSSASAPATRAASLNATNDIAMLRSVLDPVAFKKASAEGRGLSFEEAVAYAQRGRGERKPGRRGGPDSRRLRCRSSLLRGGAHRRRDRRAAPCLASHGADAPDPLR